MRSDLTVWMMRGIGLAVGVLIVIAIVQVGIAAGRVLLLIFVGVLLASALGPIVGWLRARLPLGRVGAIVVVYLSFFLVMLAMAFIVVPAAVNQAGRIAAQLPPFFDEVRTWAANLRPVALSTSITALLDSVESIFAPAPPPASEEVVEVGAAVAEAALSFFTLLAIVFFWLLEHARLQRYSLAYLPAHRRAGRATPGMRSRTG